ncbi:MAG: anhydro-N-acetylmuramic acid kinase [Candidatus Thioglobus sp.]|nr:anhydro-N-acetylmuramic acid kinase [Candidatus Thioglobus sp.]
MAKIINYIGLMAGTSLDGVDAVIVDSACKKILASHFLPYPKELKNQLKNLAKNSQTNLKTIAELDITVARIFAKAANQLLQRAKIDAKNIQAIGSHGQTIYHQGGNYSWQIGHGALISELTGITTVADFRMPDIAAGGQGAPLTPKYHQYLLAGKDGVFVNLGGIANITIVKNSTVCGFDTGPANTLLDNWIAAKKQLDYDENGLWAGRGSVDDVLLKALLADDYFAQNPPKSTGTEYFNLRWLEAYLTAEQSDIAVQRTLLELSAVSISSHIPTGSDVYLCGGGVHNLLLVERLKSQNPNSKITTTAALNADPDFVEAAAFAYFAQQTLAAKPSNLPEVTGAKSTRILGAIYAK